MTEGAIVILGTLTILGIVAIVAIALVYNRALSVKASSGKRSIEVQATENGVRESDHDLTAVKGR